MDFNNPPQTGNATVYPKVHNELSLMLEGPLIYFYCLTTKSSFDMTFQHDYDLELARGNSYGWLMVQTPETWLIFADYMCVTQLSLLAEWDTSSDRAQKLIHEYPGQSDQVTEISVRHSHAWCDKVAADEPSFEKENTRLVNKIINLARPKSR